jgi:transcriptional regulator with XRE-family HTH domain
MSPAAQGRRLSALLYKLGWSQAELALRTGISAQNVNRYCKGHRSINDKAIWKIANATGLTPGYILDGDLRLDQGPGRLVAGRLIDHQFRPRHSVQPLAAVTPPNSLQRQFADFGGVLVVREVLRDVECSLAQSFF